MKLFGWFRRKPDPIPATEMRLIDDQGEVIDDPVLTSIVNHAWRTGEPVIWNEGDDLPNH